MALERLLPESLLDDLLLRLEAAHLLHAQHQAELVELGRQQHLHVFYPFRRAYPNSIMKLSVEFLDKNTCISAFGFLDIFADVRH